MNDEQKVILSLLKEIDAVCQDEQIPYFLSPRLTLNAYYQAGIPENPLFGTIFMKAADMERFRTAASGKLKKNRALESMMNSPYFPGFYLRYVHTGTLMYHLNKGRNYLYPGIGIDICPLRQPGDSPKGLFSDRSLETGWKQTCDLYNEEFTLQDKFCMIPVKVLELFGRRRLGAFIYQRLLKANSRKENKCRVYVERDPKTLYPAELFEKTRDIPLEGLVLKCPSDVRKYLKAHYGEDFRRRLATNYIPSWACMISTRIPCAHFIKEAGDLEELIWRRRDGYLKDKKGRNARIIADETWDYLKFLEKGLNLGARYKEKLPYLRNLKEDQDYIRLESAFSKYHEMTREYLEKDMLYCPDDQVFQIYLEMLRNTGKSAFAEKLHTLYIRGK